MLVSEIMQIAAHHQNVDKSCKRFVAAASCIAWNSVYVKASLQ